MKTKIAAILLTAATALAAVTGCVSQKISSSEEIRKDTKRKLIKAAQKNVETMVKQAGNETYLKLITTDARIMENAKEFARTDPKELKAIYEIKIDTEKLMSLASEELADSFNDLEGDMKDFIINRAYAAIPIMINSQNGNTSVAATSMLTASGSMIYRTLEEPKIFISVYESGRPVLTQFSKGNDEDIVGYGSFWLMLDPGEIDSAGDLEEILKKALTSLEFKVEKVK